jgi:hypothetical protein
VANDSTAAVRDGTTQVVKHCNIAVDLGARIRVLDAPASPTERYLGSGSIVLGAGRGADLVISDESVSRRHLQITVSAQGIEVVDLGSRNGTIYRGGRVGRLTLDKEATLLLGRVRVSVGPESASGATVAPERLVPGIRTASGARARLYDTLVHLLRLPTDVIEQLEDHIWSGNLNEFGTLIDACTAVESLAQVPFEGDEPLAEMLRRVLDVKRPYLEQKEQLINRFIDVYLSMLLEHTGGNQSAAARLSGIDRAHLNKMIAKFRREANLAGDR